MKLLSKIALTIAVTALLPFAANGDTVTFNIDNVDTTATSVPPSSSTPPLSLTISDLTRVNGGNGALVSNTSSSTGYPGASGMNNVTAPAIAGTLSVANSTYFTFTFTPDSTTAVLVSALSFGSRSTASGPTTLSVFSSLDNFTNPAATFSAMPNSTWALYSSSTTLASALNDPLTIRIYGSGGTSASTGNWRLDDINFEYTLVPEPSVYMLLGVGLLLCGQRFLRRRRAS